MLLPLLVLCPQEEVHFPNNTFYNCFVHKFMVWNLCSLKMRLNCFLVWDVILEIRLLSFIGQLRILIPSSWMMLLHVALVIVHLEWFFKILYVGGFSSFCANFCFPFIVDTEFTMARNHFLCIGIPFYNL